MHVPVCVCVCVEHASCSCKATAAVHLKLFLNNQISYTNKPKKRVSVTRWNGECGGQPVWRVRVALWQNGSAPSERQTSRTKHKVKKAENKNTTLR